MSERIEHQEVNFTTIPNSIIEASISANAVRMYLYLKSKPSRWEFNRSDIKNRLGIKDNHAFAKYIKELEDGGWIKREQNNENGKFGAYEYKIYFAPYGEKPHTVPYGENTDVGKNPTHSNTELISNTKNIKEQSQNPIDLMLVEEQNSLVKFNQQHSKTTKKNQMGGAVISVTNFNLITRFAADRAARKKPMTPHAQELLDAKLSKLSAEGYDIEELIDEAIMSGWQSVYPKNHHKKSNGAARSSDALSKERLLYNQHLVIVEQLKANDLRAIPQMWHGAEGWNHIKSIKIKVAWEKQPIWIFVDKNQHQGEIIEAEVVG